MGWKATGRASVRQRGKWVVRLDVAQQGVARLPGRQLETPRSRRRDPFRQVRCAAVDDAATYVIIFRL